MTLASILNDRPDVRRYSMLPEGSRIDLDAEHLELLRRHLNLGTYRLTHFLTDVKQCHHNTDRPIVTTSNLALHLQAIRAGESAALGRPISAERVREMILDVRFSDEELAAVDTAVLEELGLAAMAR